MRIALCIECPLLQHGGVEVLVRKLILGLDESFQVYLVSEDEDIGDLPPIYQSKIHGHFHYDASGDKSIQAGEILLWGKDHGIELFHFHHGGTYSWNSRSWTKCVITNVSRGGFRCVSTNHGAFGLMLFVGEQRSLLYKLLAMCLCWPAKIRQVAHVEWEATVSMHDFDAVRRWFFPVKHKFVQIYHSVLNAESSQFHEKKKYILCLGTVGARKGQQYLAGAFGLIAKQYPEWKLVIAGRHADDGMAKEMMEEISLSGAEMQVEVIKEVSDAMAVELVQSAAIFAMPSIAEGLGLSLQEAMFAGAACVGSGVGGITDMIVNEKTGLLVAPKDLLGLRAALIRLMDDSELRVKLGKAGREHIIAKGMNSKGMCAKHEKLYNLGRV